MKKKCISILLMLMMLFSLTVTSALAATEETTPDPASEAAVEAVPETPDEEAAEEAGPEEDQAAQDAEASPEAAEETTEEAAEEVPDAANKAVSKAALLPIDDKAVCYTPQNDYRSGDCILTATKVMIRRASILRGSTKWDTISNKTLRSSATIVGLLLHRFTFEADGLAYKVRVGFFKGNTDAARIKEFNALIKEHPEGVVVWGSNASVFGMHGVLLTAVKNGNPYVMDSWYNLGPRQCGIQTWADSSMKNPSRCTQYWIIKEVGLAKNAKAPEPGKPLAPTSATKVPTESTLALRDKTVPSVIMEGDGFGVEGVVSSNYRISNVTVQIIDANGNAVISKSAKPGGWGYDLIELDSSIKFGTLAPGEYTYRISATDEKKSLVFLNESFTVTPKPVSPVSSLKISGTVVPSSLYLGEAFSISGKITSNYKISSVMVSVIDEEGRTLLSASASPNAKSYNISNVDAKIRFGTLAAGTYKFKVSAKDSKQTSTLVNRSFEVIKRPTDSTLKIKSYNYPSSIKKGKPFSIKGKITSNKKITSVKVQVINSSGKTVLSASAKPNAKSYQIKKLDNNIRFGKLKKGTYTYKVLATDTLQTLTLLNKGFKVK